jgi:hypothetical protein
MPKLELNNDYNEKPKFTHSAETLTKISLAKKGSVREVSAETRAKITDTNRANLPYVYTPRGRFANRFEAAEQCNQHHDTIKYRCKSKRPKWANWYFVEKN